MSEGTKLDISIKQLETLKVLLNDPYLADIAYDYLSAQRKNRNPSNGAAIAPSPELHNEPRKGRKRKRGALEKKVFGIVNSSTERLTAKQVTELMERDGHNFSAEDKYISVSKALRSLAKKEKIDDKKSSTNPKAAILYSRLPTLVPVQGERTH